MKDNDKGNTTQKPETAPLFRYYFIEPIQDLGWEILDTLECFWRWFTGAWYCDHCKKYHGRRVTKYTIKPSPIEKPSEAIADRAAKDLRSSVYIISIAYRCTY